jgi:Zn-dependent M28 family amino/carboxypeptidase
MKTPALLATLCVLLVSFPSHADDGKLDPTAATIDGARFLAHIKTLASDEFEGRSPSSKGETLAIHYIADQMKAIGIAPGNPDGTYFQRVPLVSYRSQPTPLALAKGDASKSLAYGDDYIAWTRRLVDHADLDAEAVFVGYGVTAPEFGWDDTKGQDLRGKLLVVLVNDPPLEDQKLFGGKAMTYYGRWTYKYEQAARLGAAGCLIVHENGPAGYPWDVVRNSWSGENFTTVGPDDNASLAPIEGWMTSAAADSLFALAGTSLEAAKHAALSRDFTPMSLGVRARLSFDNAIRRVESRNVVGRLPGSDPKLRDEVVVYTAHWDHLGVGVPVKGDAIYNGAVDNASGVAALLEIARAFTKLPKPPKRSILFLAPTAEERGLLGSEYYTKNPLYPLEKTVAEINMDGMNVLGPTTDVIVVGLGKSTLDDETIAVARAQGRTVKPDAEAEKGFYYRSDHFNFARAGVPALDPEGGIDYVGKPADFGRKARERFTLEDYHKPSDEYRSDWDSRGAVDDMRLLFQVGLNVANAPTIPTWREGDEFKARRDAMMRKQGS